MIITQNIHKFENQGLSIMEKCKSDEQILSHKNHQNDNNHRQHYRSKNSFNSKNNLISKRTLQGCDVAHNERRIQKRKKKSKHMNNNEQDNHSVETDTNKTFITLLNEWAMRGNRSNINKKCLVSYELVAITGNAHKPVFTFMCLVNDKTALGEGQSKKEAKQNSAAQMWNKLFEVDSLVISDKVITSTTSSDNLEVNDNKLLDPTSAVKSGMKYKNNLDMDDKELQHLKHEVQMAHNNINPIGALHELSTTYRWVPPAYSFQKSILLNKVQQYHAWCKTIKYKATCCVLHLQTTGTSNRKKEAKRIAARAMIDLISHIGIEKLSCLKLFKPKTILADKERFERKKCINITMKNEDGVPLEWNSANIFRLYFTVAVNVKTEMFSSASSSESNYYPRLKEQQLPIDRNHHKLGIEQSIIQNNSDLNALDELLTLCNQIDVQTTFVTTFVKQNKRVLNGQDKEFNVLLQVSTLPVIISIGCGATIDMAKETAAKCVLNSIKKMLMFTSSSLALT